MAHNRFEDFRDALNRTLNRTVSQSRLVIVPHTRSNRALITSVVPGKKPVTFTSAVLGNNHYLNVRMDVGLIGRAVTTLATSISYRRSADPRCEDWIFRYEYGREIASVGGYPYPVSHLHVNAEPSYYRGTKPFPDLHLPTRRLSLEEIIQHLIVEHDVPTLGPREDVLAFLDEQQQVFEQNRTDLAKPTRA